MVEGGIPEPRAMGRVLREILQEMDRDCAEPLAFLCLLSRRPVDTIERIAKEHRYC